MGLYFSSLRRQLVPTVIAGVVYSAALVALIILCNSNSVIYYKIDPYQYGSQPVDFFWGLIVSVPFAISTFFMKKDNFLDYVSLRISKKKYLQFHITATLTMCFIMVFLVNVMGVIVSGTVADIEPGTPEINLSEHILGNMQMNNPILFGVIWAVYKGFIGALICLFAQIIALYVDNLFLALLVPYAYILLENYVTSIIGYPDYSLTTAIILNRLQPTAMSVWKIAVGIVVLILIIYLFNKKLRSDHEEKC